MQVRWTPNAQSDLVQAFEFIAEESPNSALLVLDRIESGTKNLARHPEIGRVGRVEHTRELVIPNTPFIVTYRIVDEYVDILAIIHGARKWPDQL